MGVKESVPFLMFGYEWFSTNPLFNRIFYPCSPYSIKACLDALRSSDWIAFYENRFDRLTDIRYTLYNFVSAVTRTWRFSERYGNEIDVMRREEESPEIIDQRIAMDTFAAIIIRYTHPNDCAIYKCAIAQGECRISSPPINLPYGYQTWPIKRA